jgi:peptidyl-prolyl cis-trans isomerase B (cyclophilin B)
MKITKIVLVLLTLSLLFTGMVACDSTEGGQEAPETTATPDSNTGYCDMNAVINEIDSMSVSSFTETTEKTEFVKFTVKGHGEFVVRLRADIAPITVENFQKLVSEKFYDGLTFHRIIKGFMIQGGDPKGDGTGGSGTTIKGEFSQNGVRNQLSHIAGVISMARRSMPLDSATSQFFVCNADASRSLDGGYAAFGYVVAGLETVLMISDVEVTANGREMSKPVEKVVIEKVCFVTKN